MLPVTDVDIDAVKHRIDELTVQWEAVAVGQSVRLKF